MLQIADVANCMCCKLHVLQIAHVANCIAANCTYCKLYVLLIKGVENYTCFKFNVANCMCCKLNVLQIAFVANCMCCKLRVLQIACVVKVQSCKFQTRLPTDTRKGGLLELLSQLKSRCKNMKWSSSKSPSIQVMGQKISTDTGWAGRTCWCNV